MILKGMNNNTSKNNWLKDFDQDVLRQIAIFTQAFSKYLLNETKKYNLLYKERTHDFKKDIQQIIDYFC